MSKGETVEKLMVCVMPCLSSEHPVFHSEADFQHSLAWQIHKNKEQDPIFDIVLEYPFENGRRKYLDVWIPSMEGVEVSIELKYRTRSLEKLYKNFKLRDQGAQDVSRYDFINDISRLEEYVAADPQSPDKVGIAIFLTNDWLYWDPPRRRGTVDTDFLIHEGRKIRGGNDLAWSGASAGTMKDREDAICLKQSYELVWREYSQLEVGRGRFRYLMVVVKNP